MITAIVDTFGAGPTRGERPAPEPGPGELLLGIEAVGLNWSDVMQRDGTYPGGPKPPFVVGQEAAGTVVAQGAGVTSPPIGARVSALGRGLAAELAVVPAASCIAWDLDVEQRAALPIALLTAYHALVDRGHARRGETCVIHAAAGGLGHVAVQVARALGLHVIATTSPAKRAAIEADVVCGYDDLRDAAPDGVDLVIDGVGGDAFRASLAVLRPGGRMVLVGAASGQPPQLDAVKLVHRSHAVIGVHLRHLFADAALREQTIARCIELADHVRARVTTLAFADIAEAYRRLAAREVVGKLVLVA